MTTATEELVSILTEIRICGRPTKSGTACKNRWTHPYTGVCNTHTTDADKLIEVAFSAGMARSKKIHDLTYGKTYERQAQEIEDLKAEFESRPCKHMRYEDGLGHQIVKVGVYTYRWHDKESPLKVGDRVVLPGSEYRPQRWEDTVSEIGSDYVGALKDVIARA